MNALIDSIEAEQIRTDIDEFNIGNAVKVHLRIKEGEKERIQVFEGVVIAKNGRGVSKTFTVRKISSGIGVERIFPINSPFIKKIEVTRKNHVRRAKLYFLRQRRGKAARLKEVRRSK